MKVNETLMPFLKSVLFDPLSGCEPEFIEQGSYGHDFVMTNSRHKVYDFLSLDKGDFLTIANLFREYIPGKGKRRQALIDVFEDAAKRTENGEELTSIRADTQDQFRVNADLSSWNGDENFYRAIAEALTYRQGYLSAAGKRFKGYSEGAKEVRNLIETDEVKQLKEHITSFLEYRGNAHFVVTHRLSADHKEAKAKQQHEELSSFDFDSLESLITSLNRVVVSSN